MKNHSATQQQNMIFPAKRVDDTLAASKAWQRNRCELPGGVSFAHWVNEQDQVSYENLNHHTLSIYLRGSGSRVGACDVPEVKGTPGSICLFPVGHDSQWEIPHYVEFVHLYFSHEALCQLALTALDIDPRRVALPELTYVNDPALVEILHHEILTHHWQDSSERLALQQNSELMLLHLLRHYMRPGSNAEVFRGGLARAARNRVIDYMQEHLEQAITLETLADVAQLSPFHFSRMFRISMACTPHQYLTRLRIKKAQRLLLGSSGVDEPLTLSGIALQCGFSNQSHFGRVFKQIVGVTPLQYRSAS